MRIYTRRELHSRPFTTPPPLVPLSSRRWYIVHYPGAGTPPRGLELYRRWIETIHMDQRHWRGVGYNYFIDADGTVGEGAGRDVVGAHSPPHNRDGIGVNLWTSNGKTTPEAMHAAVGLYHRLNKEKGGPPLRIGWHGMDFPTECPGDQLRNWARNGMPDPIAAVSVNPSPPPPPTIKEGLFDMGDIRIIRHRKHTAQHGRWSTVKLNDKGDLTLAIGPGNVMVTVQVTANIPEGGTLQGRFYQVDYKAGQTTKRTPGATLPPCLELTHTGGQTFGSAVYLDPLSDGSPKDRSRRLRFELVAWTKEHKPIPVPRVEFRVMEES